MGVSMNNSTSTFHDGGSTFRNDPPTSPPPREGGGNIPPQFAKFWEGHAHDVSQVLTHPDGPAEDARTRVLIEAIQKVAKISPERVLDAAWDNNGKPVWLELGKHLGEHKGDGMLHVLHQHRDDLADSGIPEENIKREIMNAAKGNGKKVFRLSIADNGYILTFFPDWRKRDQ